MAILVDKLRKHPNGQWCHMTNDNPLYEEELHLFAEKIGLKRKWVQNEDGMIHYDLRPSKRELALKHGAIEADDKHFVLVGRCHRALRHSINTNKPLHRIAADCVADVGFSLYLNTGEQVELGERFHKIVERYMRALVDKLEKEG